MSTEHESVILVGDYLPDIYEHCLANNLLDAHDYDDMWDFRDCALAHIGMEYTGDCDFIGFKVPTSFTRTTKVSWVCRVEELMDIFTTEIKRPPTTKACTFSY